MKKNIKNRFLSNLNIFAKPGLLFMFLIVVFINSNAQVSGSFTGKFKRYEKNEAFSGTANSTWSDTAWKGDRIYNQIILWSTQTISSLNFTVSNLTDGVNVINASNVQLRFPQYAIGDVEARTCDAPQAYPPTGNTRTKVYLADILSTTPVTSITSADPVKIWITINVPANTPVGNYSGTITVKSGTTVIKTFSINLAVTADTLPPVADWAYHLDIWQFPYDLRDMIQWGSGTNIVPFSSQYFSIQKPFYTMLADMGQKSITAPMFDGVFRQGQSLVKWILNTNGTWSFDFTDFDKYVDSLTSWGFTGQINCFAVRGWSDANGNFSINYYDAGNLQAYSPNSPRMNFTTSPGFNTTWTSFLSQLRAHLVQKNIFNRSEIYLDEVPTDTMDVLVPLIKSENANWKIGFAGKYLLPTTESQIYEYSIILNYEDNLSHTQPAGTLTNFYTSCSGTVPNNYLTRQNSTAEMAWMAWHAKLKGYTGFLRWAYDYWTNLDVTNIQDGANTAGDYNMIYRSTNTTATQPYSSIRMEMLRDGIQDFEKMRIIGTSNITLNNAVSQFTQASGTNAQSLVLNGQSIIKQISASNTTFPVTTKITSFTPSSGLPGTVVTITGTNFTGATSVTFGSTPATSFTVVSPTTITATVGTGTTGNIRITQGITAVSSSVFTVTSNVSFCAVAGGSYQGYYVQGVTTSSALANLNYTATAFPPGGYTNYTGAAINVLPNSSFTINITNSAASNCARMKVWVDWNGDGTFTISGNELVNSSGKAKSCSNAVNYSFTITVPSTATTGPKRMRIQLKDAWLSLPVPCGTADFTATVDFTVNVQNFLMRVNNTHSQTALNENLSENIQPVKLYPNPVQNKLLVQASEKQRIKTIVVMNSSGQLVKQFYFSNSSSSTQIINISKLAPGLYFMSVDLMDGKGHVLKFIKQ